MSLTLISKYKKNGALVLSPQELRDLYLYGINIKSQDGSEIPLSTWERKILSAQQELEKFLSLKIQRQLVTETLSYYRDDYLNNLPILNTSYPVYKPVTLSGRINNLEQISYPSEWLSSYTSSDEMLNRRISLIPSGSSTGAATNVLLIGVMAQLGIRSLNLVPNYWTVQYLTGWTPDKIPMDIIDVIGKVASIQILHIMGDLVLPPGLSGTSLSIDGLSQSVNTIISQQSGAFGGRIKSYLTDIKDTLQRLEKNYKGINFAAL